MKRIGLLSEDYRNSKKPYLLLSFLLVPLLLPGIKTSINCGGNVYSSALIGSQQETNSSFLSINGTKLCLNGHEFCAIGANHADLIWPFINSSSIPENGTQVIANAANWEIKVLRFSAIGCGRNARQFVEFWYNTSTREQFWRCYDNMVNNASQNRVYLLPVLVWTTDFFEPFSYAVHNYTTNLTDNQTIKDQIRECIRELFINGSEVNNLFKEFVGELVTRYRNSTTILMWEIGNELNLSCDRGEENYTTINILQNFLDDTVNYIHGLDQNHMVGSGMAAPAYPDQGNTLEEAVYNFTLFNGYADVTSIHTYQHDLNGGQYNVSQETYINSFLDASRTMGKPMIIGEFGDNLIARPQSEFNIQVLETTLQSKIPLSLIWEWEVPSDRDENRTIFSVDPAKTPLMTHILRDYSVTQTQGARCDFDVTWHDLNYTISTLSNSTISDFQNDTTQGIIRFNVTGESGTGVCRVTVPNDMVKRLWPCNYTVRINGKTPLYNNSWTNCSETYIYFLYKHSTHEVIIVPEFSLVRILPLFMIATLVVVIVCGRKRSMHP